MKAYQQKIIALLVSLGLGTGFALKMPLPQTASSAFGNLGGAIVAEDQDLFQIARQHDLGFFELVEANPHIDPKHLVTGTDLILPSRFVLPAVKRQGIVINLGTMRLYYFPQGKPYFYTYPIGIGKQHWNTPEGSFSIVEKTKDPYWFVPDSIYEYRKKHGDPVLKVVKPGDDNPLGHYAMRLSNPTYLIHGTNDPTSVGVRSSAGCIHLYPEDIKELFENTPLHTRVTIINQPYLTGWDNKQFLLEAHLPLAELREQYEDTEKTIETIEADFPSADLSFDQQKMLTTLKNHLGIPMIVGYRQ